jgi:hypothetical protein
MNPPPSLRVVFSGYFRGLLVALILGLAFLTIAVRHRWPLPAFFQELTREPIPARIVATPPGR